MAVNIPYSHSPRPSQHSQRSQYSQPSLHYAYALNPATPVHSPHHSLASSTSSRPALHTLSLHEYRKQQNTPTSHAATPPGKTIRRKAATYALNEVERVPSISNTPISRSHPSFHPLHFSQSAHQLTTQQPLPPSPPHFFQQPLLHDQSFRSQSAEPQDPGGTNSKYPSTSEAENFFRSVKPNSLKKVGSWKPIKRLPKPQSDLPSRKPKPTSPPLPLPSAALPSATTPSATTPTNTFRRAANSSSPLAPVTSKRPRLSPLRTDSSSTDNLISNYAQPTTSTFSLSRFPQPPQLVDPSFSPPSDENVAPRVNISFATTAPATPPATPAVVHYRGASFDVVNPHESLLLRDIETPTRDTDTPDYFPIRSSEDPLVDSEMPPKGRLYGDLSEAYNSIRRCGDDSASASYNDLPVPPRRAALSPMSSVYSSPEYSYDANMGVSPLVIQKPPDSRFFLKQLTRNLTKKMRKQPEEQQELQELPPSPLEQVTHNLDGNYPRPLNETYRTAPRASFVPVDSSPLAKRTADPHLSNSSSGYPHSSGHRYSSFPLTSLLPEGPSPEVGRGAEPRISLSEGDITTGGYYDHIANYARSSVYTNTDLERSGYPPSLSSKRKSNPFGPITPVTEDFPSEIGRKSIYSFADSSGVSSRRSSRPLTQELLRSPKLKENQKTDTISGFINQYSGREGTESPLASSILEGPNQAQHPPLAFGFSQLDFGLQRGSGQVGSSSQRSSFSAVVSPIRAGHARKPAITRGPGPPPQTPPPLAPAFEYEEDSQTFQRLGPSEMFSGGSSYEDTRQLLHLSQPLAAEIVSQPMGANVPAILQTIPEPSSSHSQTAAPKTLEPSSSYSQPEAPKGLEPSSSYSQPDGRKHLEASSSYSRSAGQTSPQTPQEALDQAEQIFGEAETVKEKDGIPSMWARRHSGNFLPRNKRTSAVSSTGNDSITDIDDNDAEDDRGDWETIDKTSRLGRLSMEDSVANYSSTEGSRATLELVEDVSLPVLGGDYTIGPLSTVEQPVERESSFYRHPSPLVQHAHPFTSSPPDLRTRISVRSAPEESPVLPYTSSPPISSTAPLLRDSSRNSYAPNPYHYTQWRPGFYDMSDNEQELLNSGPNEEILYEERREVSEMSQPSLPHSDRVEPSSSTPSVQRENTFEKLTVLGPKRNLTGTPQGTGMHEVGSSLADSSSPGALFGFTPSGRQTGFYASSPSRTSSVTRIRTSSLSVPSSSPHERNPSACALFSAAHSMNNQPTISSPLAGTDTKPISDDRRRRHSTKSPTSPCKRSIGHGRAAVPGQTKLREMILAPDAQTISSGHSTYFSHFIGDRPSTSHTESPLRAQQSEISFRNNLASEHSPHLLCPEVALDQAFIDQQLHKSWIIFGFFCVLPPLLILYRFGVADAIIEMWTKGETTKCSGKVKKVAFWTGIASTMTISAAITIPILVTHAAGAL